jgi:hypothetical protein
MAGWYLTEPVQPTRPERRAADRRRSANAVVTCKEGKEMLSWYRERFADSSAQDDEIVARVVEEIAREARYRRENRQPWTVARASNVAPEVEAQIHREMQNRTQKLVGTGMIENAEKVSQVCSGLARKHRVDDEDMVDVAVRFFEKHYEGAASAASEFVLVGTPYTPHRKPTLRTTLVDRWLDWFDQLASSKRAARARASIINSASAKAKTGQSSFARVFRNLLRTSQREEHRRPGSLVDAVRSRNAGEVHRILIGGLDPEGKNEALQTALAMGIDEIVQDLRKHGAQVPTTPATPSKKKARKSRGQIVKDRSTKTTEPLVVQVGPPPRESGNPGYRELLYLTTRDWTSGAEKTTQAPMLVLNESEPNRSDFVGPDVNYTWTYDAWGSDINGEEVPLLRLVVEFTRPRAKTFTFYFGLAVDSHRSWLKCLAETGSFALLDPGNRNPLVNPWVTISTKRLATILKGVGTGSEAKRTWWKFW